MGAWTRGFHPHKKQYDKQSMSMEEVDNIILLLQGAQFYLVNGYKINQQTYCP